MHLRLRQVRSEAYLAWLSMTCCSNEFEDFQIFWSHSLEKTKERFVPLPIGLPHHCDGLHRGNLRAASDAEALHLALFEVLCLPTCQRWQSIHKHTMSSGSSSAEPKHLRGICATSVSWWRLCRPHTHWTLRDSLYDSLYKLVTRGLFFWLAGMDADGRQAAYARDMWQLSIVTKGSLTKLETLWNFHKTGN